MNVGRKTIFIKLFNHKKNIKEQLLVEKKNNNKKLSFKYVENIKRADLILMF